MARVLNLEDLSESTSPVSLSSQMAIVILTAGRGSRMRSSIPKVLHTIAGLPMIEHVVRAVESLHPRQVIMVTGPTSEALHEDYQQRVDLAWQPEPLGTGHAVLSALPVLRPEIRWVMVVFGDHPMTDTETLELVVAETLNVRPLVTLLGVSLVEPGAYARFVMSDDRVTGIIEAREDDTDYSNNSSPVLVNSGICCFAREWLETHLPQVQPSASGEIYLTSLIEVAAASAHSYPVAHVVGRRESAFGVNNRAEAAEAERTIRQRINHAHMLAGVTLVDPANTYIEADVEIGQDSRIEPGCTIRKGTVIGAECRIGPGTVIERTRIGDRVTVVNSTIEDSVIGDGVDVGPYAHLRPGSRISAGVHIGNYVETKNATVGSGSAIGHFSYVGDATIGSDVNVGAGTITCNFDGERKHQTTVGNRVFLGSDTLLVAPVTVGDGARTGAGSVVNKDVPEGATVVGVPARLIRRRAQE